MKKSSRRKNKLGKIMEWISVKDRFPTKLEQTHPNRILVYFSDSDLMGIQPDYSPIGPCQPYEYLGPSHWMPAPKSPKLE